MTPFTVPVAMDTFSLWIKQPEIESGKFRDKAKKVLMPFSTDLWLAIIIVILVFGVASAAMSPSVFHEDEAPKRSFKRRGRRGKASYARDTMVNAIVSGTLDFMGGAVAYDIHSNASQKFMNFGFGLFIFVTVTAYTANLAAFLTLSGTTTYISSIQDAISRNVPLCGPPQIKRELVDLYPDANWFFGDGISPIESFAAGNCDAMVQGWLDMRGNPTDQAQICEHNLVRVGNTLLEKPIAFPADKEIVAGLSHWIAVAETEGVSFMDYLLSVETLCGFDIVLDNSASGGMQKFQLSNMILPVFVFGICTICAAVLRVRTILRKKGRKRLEGNDTGESAGLKSSEMEMVIEEPGVDQAVSDIPECAPPSESPFATEDVAGNINMDSIMEDAMEELFQSQQKVLRKYMVRARRGNATYTEGTA